MTGCFAVCMSLSSYVLSMIVSLQLLIICVHAFQQSVDYGSVHEIAHLVHERLILNFALCIGGINCKPLSTRKLDW